jgi:hypothetical protein
MKALVVYESMYGNTHQLAEAIADGLRKGGDAEVVPVDQADASHLNGTDLVVVGGPTHAHSMSREGTRKAAVAAAQEPDSDLDLDPDAEGPGVREWLSTVDGLPSSAAAFDTRFDGPAAFTGRASKAIARKLGHLGCTLVVPPQSFLVTKETRLEPHELDHARSWGAEVAASVGAGAHPTT